MTLFGKPPVLRDYQDRGITDVWDAVARGLRRLLLVLPTGAGKTVIAAAIIRMAVAQGMRVLFMAPRRELVTQTCAKLDDVAIEHGVLLAGADARAGLLARVQVGSIDTVVSRVKRGRVALPPFDLVILDEAHLGITEVRGKLVDLWPDAIRLGLTATPCRGDGRALGLFYDHMIEPATTAWLTEHGFLAPARYFSWPPPDLRGVKITAGDYNQQQLGAVMNQTPLLGDIVEHYDTLACERRGVVFATTIDHAIALAGAFRDAGIAAEAVSAKTPTPERNAIMARFRSGETQVLTNCVLASHGFDVPDVSCIVLARPTRSLMLFLQMLGRGLRIADGKRDCLVLDHSGCVLDHGFATDERAWTLEGKYALAKPAAGRVKAEAPAKQCPECNAVWTGSATCPECGYELRPKGKLEETRPGHLVEVGQWGARPEPEDARRFYAELRGYVDERGWKPGAAAAKFRERYNAWPPRSWNADPVLAPSLATRSWVKARQIAWVKSRGAA